MMEVLVTVQSERRVWQPLAAPLEDVVRHVVVAHPSEFDIGEGLGDALHHSILHGHAIGECLVTIVLRPILLGGIQDGEQVSVAVLRVSQPLRDQPCAVGTAHLLPTKADTGPTA